MKVSELVRLLSLCDQDSEVRTEGCDCMSEGLAVVVDLDDGETIIARTYVGYDDETDEDTEQLTLGGIRGRNFRRVE